MRKVGKYLFLIWHCPISELVSCLNFILYIGYTFCFNTGIHILLSQKFVEKFPNSDPHPRQPKWWQAGTGHMTRPSRQGVMSELTWPTVQWCPLLLAPCDLVTGPWSTPEHTSCTITSQQTNFACVTVCCRPACCIKVSLSTPSFPPLHKAQHHCHILHLYTECVLTPHWSNYTHHQWFSEFLWIFRNNFIITLL